MTRRERGRRVKQIVEQVLNKNVKVHSGRGTAYSWLYIILSNGTIPTREQKEKVIELCKKEELLGFYFTYYGGGVDGFEPNILWKTEDGTIY